MPPVVWIVSEHVHAVQDRPNALRPCTMWIAVSFNVLLKKASIESSSIQWTGLKRLMWSCRSFHLKRAFFQSRKTIVCLKLKKGEESRVSLIRLRVKMARRLEFSLIPGERLHCNDEWDRILLIVTVLCLCALMFGKFEDIVFFRNSFPV